MASSTPERGLTIDVGGTATNYHDRGDGPPVLLIHGSGPGVSAWANWRTVLPALSSRFRVVAPDIVGFGYTQRPPDGRYDPEVWAAHLLGFLDALDISRVSIVGNSFGGALAMRLAAVAPDRVDRLVLMGSVGVRFPITDGLEAVWGFEPSLESMRGLLDVFTYDTERLADGLAEMRLAAAMRPGVHESYAAMFPAPRQRVLDALAVAEDDIAALRHRTLLVHGRDDNVIPLDVSFRLLHLIENSELHVFARCGHWVQIERADRFTALVTDFLTAPDREPTPAR
ncbi:2,6-dioxo-6-phenylhexa-3-enoate hydrolase [Virgisporangium aliadipatigenens]|uniref:2,6-dioxo-6-phenylhexa-3-enoate hydrolase n=1 Tax=Virgisporangium aliadipatigenens TaxID=741659 RepID=A0A8J3YUK8_9ACTN|nr:alpha/beta fold hydrolase [Virgisporangium aliadipatigenens]GIJ51974.1 2,6-dioxo-6-phenylhexa-3-enoate hydrolase [Virgisporangium aliadipatigenens]